AQGWSVYKFPTPAPVCTGLGHPVPFFDKSDCGFGYVPITNTVETDVVNIHFAGPAGQDLGTQQASWRTTGDCNCWEFDISPASSWPSGVVTISARVQG